MLVLIGYSDGQHWYRKLNMSDANDRLRIADPDVAEVDDQIVILWDAICELDRTMAKQLCEIDNKLWAKWEACNKSGS